MLVDLTDTDSSAIAAALLDIRRRGGSPAIGMVLTLVIVTDEDDHQAAVHAATQAAKEHPCRILTAIPHSGRVRPRLDAEVRVGGETGLVESVVLRTYGPLGRHADSVVLPLLLPDTPVVVWWPGAAPADAADTALGRLAQRRVTDAASAGRPAYAIRRRAATYQPGDTDFTWTRLTPWRTLLAASLDQHPGRVRGGSVAGERGNPSAALLVTWLRQRLGVSIDQEVSDGPGITEVCVQVPGGTIKVNRPDGQLATLNRPGDPERRVALPRRDVSELLVEELRRLDPDEVYAETLAAHARRTNGSRTNGGRTNGGRTTATKTSATKRRPSRTK